MFNVKYFLANNGLELERSGTLGFAPTAGIKFVLDGDERVCARVVWVSEHQIFEVTLRSSNQRLDFLLERGWNLRTVGNAAPACTPDPPIPLPNNNEE